MLKRLFWAAVLGALLLGAYVQETGKGLSSLPEPLRSWAQTVQAYSARYSSLVDSKFKQPEQQRKLGERRSDAKPLFRTAAEAPRAAQLQQSFVAGSRASGSGTVIRILADDRTGSQHQKFILQLASGQTLLIAHNIDLAERLESLSVGDTVAFCGEYASNPEGGVIHWTHRDPKGRHPAGWLQYKGRTYQ